MTCAPPYRFTSALLRAAALAWALVVGSRASAEPPAVRVGANESVAAAAGDSSGGGGRDVPLATQLKFFDFNERPLGNYEDLPMHWTQLGGPGLPAFCRGRFDDSIGHTAPPSFRIALQGVGANVAFEYAHDDLLIEPEADYLVSGYARCEGLQYSRALLTAYLVDRFGERIAGSECVSNLVAATSAAQPPWQRLEMPVSAEFPGAFAMRVQVWVLQTTGWRRVDSESADPIRREDVRATLWLDDVRIVRVPRARLKLSSPSGLVRVGATAALEFEVNGVGEQAFEVQFTISDENAKPVHQQRMTLTRDAPMPLRIPVPALPVGRYEASARLFVGEERVLSRAVTLAVISELPPRSGAGDIGVDIGGWTVGDIGGLQALLAELRCREIKLHVHILEQIDALETIQHLRRLGQLLRTLAEARIDTVGVIRPPLSALRGQRPPSTLEYITQSTRWREMLGPLLAQMGGSIAAWQVGDEEAEISAGAVWDAAAVNRLREQVRRFVSIPEMAAPSSALDGGTAAPDVIRSVMIPGRIPACELARHLEFLVTAERQERFWLMLETPSAREYSRTQRLIDYVRRITIARALEPDRIFLKSPFELRTDGGTSAWAPAEEYIPLRTLLHYLNGSQAAGVLRFGGETIAIIFRNDGESQRGFAVAWTWRQDGDVPVTAYLGREVKQVDLLGRRADLPEHDGLTEVRLRPMPVILDNIDVALALLQSSFSLTPDYLETHQRRTKPTLRFRNHYNSPANGSIEVHAPGNWSLTPRTVEFSLAPGQELEKALDLVVPPRQSASTQKLDVTINMRSPHVTALKFNPPVTIGLRDVAVEVTTQWNGDVLLVDQSLRNLSSAVVNFASFCDAPQRARQESQFLEVPPGETRARRYTFPNARDLSGKRLRTGVQEIGGPRSLDQLVDVKD